MNAPASAAALAQGLFVRKLDAASPAFDAEFARLIAFEAAQDAEIDARVASIVADVRGRGDAAVLEYTARFDRLTAGSVTELRIDARELAAAFEGLPEIQREALRVAATRIRDYHSRQV